MATEEDDPWEEVAKLIECPICFEVYKEPVNLRNCCHTFCRGCLEGMKKVTKDESLWIECPTCRIFTKAGEYDDNVVVNLYKELLNYRPSTNANCGSCENSRSSWRCTDCSLDLCDSCKDSHTQDPANAEHQLQASNNVGGSKADKVYCEEHPKRKLKLYCTDCQALLCKSCITSVHKDHAYVTIGEQCDKVKAELEKLCSSMQMDVDYYKGQEEFLSSQREAIERRYNEVLAQYKEEKERLTNLVLDAAKVQGDEVNEIIDKALEDTMEQIENAEEENEFQIEQKEDIVLLNKVAVKYKRGLDFLNLVTPEYMEYAREEAKRPMETITFEASIPVYTPCPDIPLNTEYIKMPDMVTEKIPRPK